ncbi:MAG: IS66 family insertion sequence element accessory protein TnpB, partial [Brucella intermedia]
PDSLLSLVRDRGCFPLKGALYVFRANLADIVKIVWWEGSGVCIYPNDWKNRSSAGPASVTPGTMPSFGH